MDQGADSESTEPIGPFRGRWSFLSNFFPAQVWLNGVTYPTVEHAYQAARCANDFDRVKIRDARTPGAAKRLGRSALQIDGWEAERDEIMRELLEQKFRYAHLRVLLRTTGSR